MTGPMASIPLFVPVFSFPGIAPAIPPVPTNAQDPRAFLSKLHVEAAELALNPSQGALVERSLLRMGLFAASVCYRAGAFNIPPTFDDFQIAGILSMELRSPDCVDDASSRRHLQAFSERVYEAIHGMAIPQPVGQVVAKIAKPRSEWDPSYQAEVPQEEPGGKWDRGQWHPEVA